MLLLIYGFCLRLSCGVENGSYGFRKFEYKDKRRKSMNGKRVRMAVMSAVILSALAVSGCSSEGSVSYNGSGEKADDVSSLSAPVTSDITSIESKETQEQTSSDSKPADTSTNKAETTAVTTKKDNAVKSEWKETKADGTKYVTVGCYSREKPFSEQKR